MSVGRIGRGGPAPQPAEPERRSHRRTPTQVGRQPHATRARERRKGPTNERGGAEAQRPRSRRSPRAQPKAHAHPGCDGSQAHAHRVGRQPKAHAHARWDGGQAHTHKVGKAAEGARPQSGTAAGARPTSGTAAKAHPPPGEGAQPADKRVTREGGRSAGATGACSPSALPNLRRCESRSVHSVCVGSMAASTAWPN